MLTHPTLDHLRALRLDGMAEAFAELQAQDGARDLPHADWLALLLDREVADRNTRRFRTRLRAAALRHVGAAIEDVDYRTPRRLDRALFQRLATGTWIEERRNLLITGPCGVGKTWLACALGQKACRDNRTVLYKRLPRLFAELELAHGDGRFPRLFRSLVRADLLILDDWGPDRMTAGQRRDLMEIVEDRCGTASTLVTSQLPVGAWHAVIDEPTFADPSSTGWSTPPAASTSTVPRCASSRPATNSPRPGHDRRAQPDARPRASTGPSRARRRVSPKIGTPRRARGPPIDDGDGLRRA